jgi:RNA polymerase sigma-70 factor (ECF subfamily)
MRVRDPSNLPAWREFDAFYGELILRYCRRRGLRFAQAEDVRQMVLLNLSQALPGFEYDPDRGGFRGYLGRTVRNAIARFLERHEPRELRLMEGGDADCCAAVAADELDERWEQEWTRYHACRAMQRLRLTFDRQSLDVFERLLAGATVADLASELSISQEAVRKIKQRVRERLTDVIREQVAAEERAHGRRTES